jgi:(1->4)-alpha-D-glucan 1-alpha-D-glucosylmutase
VGAWPIGDERIVAYMEKAAREAKTHTSWNQPNSVYESALRAFVEGILHDPRFKSELESFVKLLVEPGRVNSLAQTLIKLTAPGIPDFYQGSELWDLSLVDPDNRRPVDYDLRRRLLAELDGLSPEQLWSRLDEGMPKLWLIRQTLKLRREKRLLMPQDSYCPLVSRGKRALHVVAFARGDSVITIVPRLILKTGGRWADTTLELPSGHWLNEFTGDTFDGGVIRVASLLKRFPVALLSRKDHGA